ncbi:hypothetical protein TIFTF001_021945 [Ficus carica]|uniref:Phytocyanin domain-containing protein n=1 Tax=Ficus carica TaxID=3494 RepID=A0AA88ADN3_FICCA|nr:hypothetical protein TIFTF001_021945 [Ficus carica]
MSQSTSPAGDVSHDTTQQPAQLNLDAGNHENTEVSSKVHGRTMPLFQFKHGQGAFVLLKEDFDTCKFNHPHGSIYPGSATYRLSKAGDVYFSSEFPWRCQRGQKFAIHVSS